MNNLYNFAVQELKNFSETLDKKALLVNKPWTLIDNDQELQRLIFKKNKELIVSKNGDVAIGTWDYLSEANSLLINRQGKAIMLNEGFVNEAVLILKKDGTDDDYFILANQNIIPDLDVVNYLKQLRYKKLNITTLKLESHKNLEIHNFAGFELIKGNTAAIENNITKDGYYFSKNGKMKFKIISSKIENVFYLRNYKIKSQKSITVHQENKYVILRGDEVFCNNQILEDGKYQIIEYGKIVVENGLIIKARPSLSYYFSQKKF